MNAKQSFKSSLSSALVAMLLVLSMAGILPVHPASAATGTIYYVDSMAGNNANDGKSPNSPWKTLEQVRASGALFQPGDQILLKSGSVWNESLDITFSGTDVNPINVGKYGGDAKPVINGGGGNYAVRIVNRQNITIRDLELTNYNSANYDDYKTAYYRRSGVWIQAFHNGPMNNIHLIGLDIHDVTGISVTGESWVKDTDGDMVNKNHNAAIMANAWEWETNVPADKHAYYTNLLIQDCNIHDIRTIGINVDGYTNDPNQFHKNLVIRNNTINKTGSDGIIVGVAANPLIEHNAAYDVGINSVDGKWIAGMWVWKTIGATFQYNEVARVHYQNSASTDSNAFDVDILAQGDHLFQYNYTHDNAGGFAMDMGQLQNGKNIYRYNISQNDQRHGFTGYTMNISDPGLYYNNVFYNDNGDGFVIKDNAQATFMNNIFYTSKGNSPFPSGPKFYNNDFFGSAPPSQGLGNLTLDPKFVNPGKGAEGMGTVGGYKLQPDSPLIGAGRKIEDNGGMDFWGNALYTGSPDIGVYEDPGSAKSDTTAPSKPTGLKVLDKTDTTVTLTWSAVENGVPLDGDIYDAATDTRLTSVVMSNTAALTGFAPDMSYSFYVVAKDLSGNLSPKSDPITVNTTFAPVVVDNGSASVTGTWTTRSGSSSYNGDYLTIPAGSATQSITWTPNLPKEGYYSVYYQLPDGNAGRATNAPFTVNFNGGSKTYAVNERAAGGSWMLLGIHKFAAGTNGNVTLTDNANGEVAADAIKFLYNDGFGPGSITKVVLAADKLQLKIGDKMGLSVMGTDDGGKSLDLAADGFSVTYQSDSQAVSISETGVITGISKGTANIRAKVTINGTKFTSNSVQVIVGPGFTVNGPTFTDFNGQPLASFSPYGLVQTSVKAINSTDTKQNVTLIVAVYNQKGLVKTDLRNVVIQSYENTTLTSTVIMPGDVTGCYLKVFVWDSKDAMHPLAARTIYPK